LTLECDTEDADGSLRITDQSCALHQALYRPLARTKLCQYDQQRVRLHL
jgi:hypothetical protein